MKIGPRGENRRGFFGDALRYLGLGGLALHTFGRPSSAAPEITLERDSYHKEVEALRRVDLVLILYEEVVQIEPGLKKVWDMTVDSEGRLHLVGDRAIRALNASGHRLGRIALDDSPRCITLDAAGRMYVGLTRHVEIYEPDGTRLARWDALHQDTLLTSIAVSDDRVFLADAGNRLIWRCDGSGKVLGRIEGEFVVPSPYFDLATSPDGHLKVANPGKHRVETYTLDGEFVSHWGKFSRDVQDFFGCCNPINMALLPDGRFIVAEKGIPRVKIHDAEGGFECVVAAPASFPRKGKSCSSDDPFSGRTRGLDVAVDPEGRVLVYDPDRNLVRAFARKRSESKPLESEVG